MREILFRGKRVYSKGEWVYGSLFQTEHCVSIWSEEIIDDVEVYHETVGQYTGLQDRNGKKVFEGDILTTTNPNCRIWFVDYKPTSFCANQTNANYSCVLDEFFVSYNVEVIGNIHDNPELLDVK